MASKYARLSPQKCGGEHRPGRAGRSKNPGHFRAMNSANMNPAQIAELEGLMDCNSAPRTAATLVRRWDTLYTGSRHRMLWMHWLETCNVRNRWN